jgi:uncharacterized protein
MKTTMTKDLNDWMSELMALSGEPGSPGRSLPPVHLWHPAHCGDIGLEIRADGSWWHEGARITRQPLVNLFATILRKDEDGQTYLVTPGEKVIVRVEDAPFVGVRADRLETDNGQVIAITTNLGEVVALGPDNPLRVQIDPVSQEPRPYVLVRGGLEARILRAPFYDLVNWASEEQMADETDLKVVSNGMTFALGPSL